MFNKKDICNIFSNKINNLFLFNKLDKNYFDNLFINLIKFDFGFDFSIEIINFIKNKINIINNNKDLEILIKNYFYSLYKKKIINFNNKNITNVFIFFGINGVGRTTCLIKLANYFYCLGKNIVLSASDTFNYISIDIIKYYGKLINVPVISQNIGSDSCSVIYDTINYSIKRNKDYIFIDTTGRLQNKYNLMLELKKIFKIISIFKVNCKKFLVLDINNGQNILDQVYGFKKYIDISGIILTKIDIMYKFGIIFSLIKKFNIPIEYITFGEKITDICIFDYKYFINCII